MKVVVAGFWQKLNTKKTSLIRVWHFPCQSFSSWTWCGFILFPCSNVFNCCLQLPLWCMARLYNIMPRAESLCALWLECGGLAPHVFLWRDPRQLLLLKSPPDWIQIVVVSHPRLHSAASNYMHVCKQWLMAPTSKDGWEKLSFLSSILVTNIDSAHFSLASHHCITSLLSFKHIVLTRHLASFQHLPCYWNWNKPLQTSTICTIYGKRVSTQPAACLHVQQTKSSISIGPTNSWGTIWVQNLCAAWNKCSHESWVKLSPVKPKQWAER